MARMKNPRGKQDDYLDGNTFWPYNEASAEALGIVCAAVRLAFRDSRYGLWHKSHLEIVGPKEMMEKLNQLWNTYYVPGPYCPGLFWLRTFSQKVIITCLKLGFVFGNDETTIRVAVIKEKVPKEYWPDFERGLEYGRKWQKEFTKVEIPKAALEANPRTHLKSRYLKPQNIKPDTAKKAYAFGYFAALPKIWFRLKAENGGREVSLAGPEQLLTKLMSFWGVSYRPKVLSANPPQVYIDIRTYELSLYIAKLGIANLDRAARKQKMRDLVSEELRTDFDKGSKEAETLLTEAAQKTIAKKETRKSGFPTGHLSLEEILPLKPATALAYGLLSVLKIVLSQRDKPLHHYIEIIGPPQALSLLQELWQIEGVYQIANIRTKTDYHFIFTSKEISEYLKALLDPKSKIRETRFRAQVPEDLKLLFNEGKRLGQRL